jgi:ParB family chromosome partitioning protein
MEKHQFRRASEDGADRELVAPEEVGDRVVMVLVGEVVPSEFQPRQVFDEVKLRELADSIRSIGIMQPLIVRRRKGNRHEGTKAESQGAENQGTEGRRDGGAKGEGSPLADARGSVSSATGNVKYELVAGERRWRAAQLAGLARVPAIVRELDDQSCASWGLVENVQREDLDPMERAAACRVMMERFGWSQSEVAEQIGLDRSTVANLVRLTELEPEIQQMLRRGELTMGHAKLLLGVSAPSRLVLAKRASAQGWSVRALEEESKKSARGLSREPERRIAMGKSASVQDLEKRLGEHFGTRVKIKTDKSGKRGKVELTFYNLDHFEGLMDKLGYGLGQ